MSAPAPNNILTIHLNNPPLNTLSLPLRRNIMARLEAGIADENIQAIIIYGSDRVFSAGADIHEFASRQAFQAPDLARLLETIAGAPKPIIAAVGQICMGGGLELALACHWRVFLQDGRIGFPEIQLGLLPGAGGTQRLPRATGLPAALEIILSGAPVAVDSFRDTPLVDLLVESDLPGHSQRLAQQIIRQASLPRRLDDRDVAACDYQQLLQQARDRYTAQPATRIAARGCLDALEAACSQPFPGGLTTEGQIFRRLLASPQSRALRHAFFAERTTAKIPGLAADAEVTTIATVAVIGAGTIGRGIAQAFLHAGYHVVLIDQSPRALQNAREYIEEHYRKRLAKGRLTPQALAERMAALRLTDDEHAIGQADLIIEAIFEDLAVKKQLFARLDRLAKPGAILASNTSMLDIDEMARSTSRPEAVVGLHFFNPAHIMKLLEVVRGEKTSPAVLAAAMKLGKTLGKTCVLARVCEGFIGNRMLNQYLRVASLLVDDGATPWQVDRALEQWGMAMGPFRMSDMAGNDVAYAIHNRMRASHPQLRFSTLPDRLHALGRFGQKTGKGWYAYPAHRHQGEPCPQLADEIAQYRLAQGITPRLITDEEIVERCIYALVNEGAHILQQGIAQRASDIDAVYLTGYGFPRWLGGPMYYADRQGLRQVVNKMASFASGGDPFWQPAPLLSSLLHSGNPLAQQEAQHVA